VQLNDIFDRIVLINLDRRPDRLAEFDEQAQRVGLTYERHAAFDAEGKTDQYGKPLRGIIACTRSHFDVLDKALNDGVERLFVFEDDANFVDNFNEEFEKTWAEMPDDWELFYGGLWLHNFNKYTERLVKPTNSYSAHAWGVDRKAMETVHRNLQGKQIIDVELSIMNERMKAYCAKPALIYQRPSYSDLDKEFRDVTDKYK
jgi:GR25 family glycosyltransferase involved in LPS biosynthesis